MFFVTDQELCRLLKEDLPLMDLTVSALGLRGPGTVSCRPKSAGLVTGHELAARLFALVGLRVERVAPDPVPAGAGEEILLARGDAAAIHAAYKVAQNIMEYSSGIARRARRMVDEAHAGSPSCQVSVTRKHFPGTKELSLRAALAGGAIVHRNGLSDSILVFDQHRAFLGGRLPEALAAARRGEPERPLAIEAGSSEEALEFARLGADIVQCERFGVEEFAALAREARAVNPRLRLSAAGGVNADNARAYAAAGADFLVTSWVYFGPPADVKMVIAAA